MWERGKNNDLKKVKVYKINNHFYKKKLIISKQKNTMEYIAIL
jgi:hypothetical protein